MAIDEVERGQRHDPARWSKDWKEKSNPDSVLIGIRRAVCRAAWMRQLSRMVVPRRAASRSPRSRGLATLGLLDDMISRFQGPRHAQADQVHAVRWIDAVGARWTLMPRYRRGKAFATAS